MYDRTHAIRFLLVFRFLGCKSMYNRIVFHQLRNFSLSPLNCTGFANLVSWSLSNMSSVSAVLSGSDGSGQLRPGDGDLEGVWRLRIRSATGSGRCAWRYAAEWRLMELMLVKWVSVGLVGTLVV